MQDEALKQFLSSVRCERFIDYLDPIGETAEEALSRRVRWARMTRNDPAHADEAAFLLEHETQLKAVLTEEIEAESSWVEGVSAGQEYGGTHWSRDQNEKTRLDPLEDLETAGTDAGDVVGDFTPTGIMRMEDITLDEPFEEGGTLSRDTSQDSWDGESSDHGLPSLAVVPSGLSARRAVRTASPAGRRVATPTLSTLSNEEMSTLPPLDAFERKRQAAIRADGEATDPSARPTADLAKAIAAAAASGDGDSDEGQTEPTAAPRTAAPIVTPTETSSGPMIPIAVGVVLLLLFAGGAYFATRGPSDGGHAPPTPKPAETINTPVPPTPGPDGAAPDPTGSASEPAIPQPVAPVPDIPAPEPTAPVQPDPAPVAPDPAPVAPDPAPVAPDPAPVAPDPTPVEPDPVPAAPDPAPVAPDPTPVEPDPASVAPDPVPSTPDPAPTANQVVGDMGGMWGGTVGDAGGLMLRILSQDGNSFTGSAEILGTSQSFRYAVVGTFTGNRVSFSNGGAVKFNGTWTNRSMSGTVKRGNLTESWTAQR